MDETKPIKSAGIEVPPGQRTPFVESLLRVIAQQKLEIDGLRAEMARLKDLPPRPTIRPSTLNASHPDPSFALETEEPDRGRSAGHTSLLTTKQYLLAW